MNLITVFLIVVGFAAFAYWAVTRKGDKQGTENGSSLAAKGPVDDTKASS